MKKAMYISLAVLTSSHYSVARKLLLIHTGRFRRYNLLEATLFRHSCAHKKKSEVASIESFSISPLLLDHINKRTVRPVTCQILLAWG